MRELCLERRNGLSPEFRAQASAQICQHVLDFLTEHALLQNREISVYLPIRSEVDLSGLIPKLESAGASISLPVVLTRTEIVFRRYRSGDLLQDAGFGTTGPAADAAIVDPQILLMPLAGFDSLGARIGYGAGHYDRALDRLHKNGRTPKTIGTGFGAQQVPQVPAEPHDILLTAIVTEAGLLTPTELTV